MSSTAPGPRPREVTIGGWAIPVASAILVVVAFDRMATLRSVATRDAVTSAISDGWARGLGLTVEDVLGLMRAALFVSGTAAAITGVLGIFVLQRHARARAVLTVAAVPVVLTAPVVGGVLGVVIGVGTALMWTRPARDWFAGRQPAVREVARPGPGWTGPASEPSEDAGRTASGWAPPPAPPVQPAPPPPTWGWGEPPPGPVVAPPGHPAPYPAPYPAAFPAPYSRHHEQAPSPPPHQPWRPQVAGPRTPGVPAPVRVACILTWVFSLLTGGVYLLLILAMVADRDGVLDLLHDNPDVRDTSLNDDQLVGLVLAISAVVLLWCLAAAALAFLTWRRQVWAWILLLVSTGVAATFGLVVLPFSLLHLAACATTFVLLLRGSTRAWLRNGPGQPPSWPSGAPPSAPPSWPPAWPPVPPPVPQPTQQPSPPPTEPQPPQEPPAGKPPVW